MGKLYKFNKKKSKESAQSSDKKIKTNITIRLDFDIVEYFKELSEETTTPYQTLINDYLKNCKDQSLRPKTTWKKTS